MIRRSVHYASYSLLRLRGWAILVVLAMFGGGIGAAGAAANLALVGALGFATPGSTAGSQGLGGVAASIGVTLACAAVVAGIVLTACDWFAPLMVRANDHDRLQSRWGLRWVGISFAMAPFILVGVVLALMAFGLDIGN
jgi:hypothetical protein